jgi:hypothetical protein
MTSEKNMSTMQNLSNQLKLNGFVKKIDNNESRDQLEQIINMNKEELNEANYSMDIDDRIEDINNLFIERLNDFIENDGTLDEKELAELKDILESINEIKTDAKPSQNNKFYSDRPKPYTQRN